MAGASRPFRHSQRLAHHGNDRASDTAGTHWPSKLAQVHHGRQPQQTCQLLTNRVWGLAAVPMFSLELEVAMDRVVGFSSIWPFLPLMVSLPASTTGVEVQ